MKSSIVLELLEQNRIEELKAKLQDQIFTESLKNAPNAKKRYSAMKKYFTLVDNPREICQKPCAIEFEGREYNAFTNSYSLVLTTESCGEIKMFDTENGTYPEVDRLIDLTGPEGRIDFERILAEAKSKGYKLKKAETMNNKYMMHYNGSYFRIALVDSAYSIIADGQEASVYHGGGSRGKLTIQNDIGIAVVMPVFMEGGPDEDTVVIEAE
jgi:hypothetical protein